MMKLCRWIRSVCALLSFASHHAHGATAAPLQYSVTWVGNSFSGASNRWVQNFFIHTQVQPDGTVNTWSHWDEGGKKFGVYKDGDVIGNTNVNPNSLETRDSLGRLWKLEVTYTDPKHQEWEFVPKGITCDGVSVPFPELYQPMALAMARDGSLMVADSGTGPRQQVLFYDVTDTLILGEEGQDEGGQPSMRHIRRVLICRGYLAGNRETVSFVPGAGREAGCVTATGDYVFTGGWKARGKVWVNRLSDGAEVGSFDPGPTVGGVANTGWIDLLTGITAFKRSTGEYLVFVEENYKAKSLIYRWKP